MSRYYRTLLSLGSSPPPPPVGLVTDLVSGFIHGYSIARKLRDAYTGNLITARRSIDDTNLGIGSFSNELNETALTDFVGSGDGYVRIMSDQVGSRALLRSVLAEQPKLVDAGSVIKLSGKPYAQYDGVNDYLRTAGSETPITDKDCTVFVVFESQSAEDLGGVFNEDNITTGQVLIASDTRNSGFRHSIYRPTGFNNLLNFPSQQPVSTKRCLIFRKSGTTIDAYDESGFVATITDSNVFTANTGLNLGRWLTFYFGGKIAELLINNTALSTTDRNLVLNNIKTFYSIT